MKKLLSIVKAAKEAQTAETTCYYDDLNKLRNEGLQECITAINSDVQTLAGAKLETKTK